MPSAPAPFLRGHPARLLTAMGAMGAMKVAGVMGVCSLVAIGLSGCMSTRPAPVSAVVPPPPPALPEPPPVCTPTMAPEDLAARQLITYQAAIGRLNGADLAKEIAKLGEPATPADTMKLALALSATHNGADIARAQGLLDRLLNNYAIEAQAWHGLARLLLGPLADQRKADEQVDRLNQQLRDSQRKLDQATDKLEALKSIERSLNNRAPAAPGPFISSPPSPPPAATSSNPSSPVIKPAAKP